MNLLGSIASKGYQNSVEPIMVTFKNNKYYVEDGNRRIAAIKLLSNPDHYSKVLDSKDLKYVKEKKAKYENNIPQTLDVTVFETTPDGKRELADVLQRKHNGPNKGVGTVPWNTKAKERFAEGYGNKKAVHLLDSLEIPYKNKFGSSLSEHLGSRITSARRVFNASAKKYLHISDPAHPSDQELEKVREYADALLRYCSDNEIKLSRINSPQVKEVIKKLEEAKDEVSTQKGGIAQSVENKEGISKPSVLPSGAQLSKKRFERGPVKERSSHLGSRYARAEYIEWDDSRFENLNMMLHALMSCGILPEKESERIDMAYLTAPAVRAIYEFALEGVRGAPGVNLKHNRTSNKHDENVEYMEGLFNNKLFKKFISGENKIFETDEDANDVIRDTDFKKSVSMTQNMAHKSIKNWDVDTVVRLFNEATLFAVLCEKYVAFKSDSHE